MNWLLPGIEILQGLGKHARGRLVGDVGQKEASRARKRIREKLWNQRNPGKRRSYDKGLLERVRKWRLANREKVREIARKYAKTAHGQMMLKAKSARYRARKRLGDNR